MVPEYNSDGTLVNPTAVRDVAAQAGRNAGVRPTVSIGSSAHSVPARIPVMPDWTPASAPTPTPTPQIETAGINLAAQPGTDAVKSALSSVSDPTRFAASDQARGLQSGVANYAGQLASGQSPYVTALQRQQGMASGMGAIASTALSNQGGMAPGLVQRNAQQAQAGLGASIDSGAQAQDIGALRSAMDASGAAANGERTQDVSQTLGDGAQRLQGAGLVATAGQQSADRTLAGQQADLSASLATRGQDISAGDRTAVRDQGAAEWQRTNDANNSWWMKYGLPSLSAGSTTGGAILGAVTSSSNNPTPQNGTPYVDPYAAGNGGSMYNPASNTATYGGQQPYATGYDQGAA